MSYFMKICPVGAKMFHANGWTDRHDELNSHFSQFCESSQKLKGKHRSTQASVFEQGKWNFRSHKLKIS